MPVRSATPATSVPDALVAPGTEVVRVGDPWGTYPN